MTKREFLDTVFEIAPSEANKIMDAFDEYVDSNEPHWHPVTERPPEIRHDVLFAVFSTKRGEQCKDTDKTESSCFGITADWNLLWMMSIEYPHGCHCPNIIRG